MRLTRALCHTVLLIRGCQLSLVKSPNDVPCGNNKSPENFQPTGNAPTVVEFMPFNIFKKYVPEIVFATWNWPYWSLEK